MSREGKYIFGTVKVGEKGQIVIPKQAREVFDINSGDVLLVLGDVNQGLAIVKNEIFLDFANSIIGAQADGSRALDYPAHETREDKQKDK